MSLNRPGILTEDRLMKTAHVVPEYPQACLTRQALKEFRAVSYQLEILQSLVIQPTLPPATDAVRIMRNLTA